MGLFVRRLVRLMYCNGFELLMGLAASSSRAGLCIKQMDMLQAAAAQLMLQTFCSGYNLCRCVQPLHRVKPVSASSTFSNVLVLGGSAPPGFRRGHMHQLCSACCRWSAPFGVPGGGFGIARKGEGLCIADEQYSRCSLKAAGGTFRAMWGVSRFGSSGRQSSSRCKTFCLSCGL